MKVTEVHKTHFSTEYKIISDQHKKTAQKLRQFSLKAGTISLFVDTLILKHNSGFRKRLELKTKKS